MKTPRKPPHTRRAYVDAYDFGMSLKVALKLAREGHCKLARYRFEDAVHYGENLAIALPNTRREVLKKISMVENTLLERGCKPRRYGWYG